MLIVSTVSMILSSQNNTHSAKRDTIDVVVNEGSSESWVEASAW